MNICYLDLNYPDCLEDYSINPKRYGGGRVFASWAKEKLNNVVGEPNTFHIFADPKCFENLGDNENKSVCFDLSWEHRKAIREGLPVKDVIPFPNNYDLFVHHHVNLNLNLLGLDAKQVCWAVGLEEYVNPKNDHLILYNQFQHPVLENFNTKVYYAKIGKPIPIFEEYKKDDYIFQCSRHWDKFNSIEIAKFCTKNRLMGVFAGPIDGNYPLMDYIDGRYTQYVGVISEEEKLKLTKYARLYTMFHSWKTPFNLSAIEALSFGTPVCCADIGFWKSLIVEGKNGFFIKTEQDLLKAWDKAPTLAQKDCWDSVFSYSDTAMVNQFYFAFEKILQ